MKLDELLRKYESNQPMRLRQLSELEDQLKKANQLLEESRKDIETWKRSSDAALSSQEQSEKAWQRTLSLYGQLDQRYQKLLSFFEDYKKEMALQKKELIAERDGAQAVVRWMPTVAIGCFTLGAAAGAVITYLVVR